MLPTEFDLALLASVASGLPVLPRPYEALGAMLGVSEARVLSQLAALLDAGLVRRIGAVANHDRLGEVVHALTVWDVDDACVDALGEQVGAMGSVSHCHRRARQPPHWPYNLFAVLHGHSRAAVESRIAAIRALLGPACSRAEVLYGIASLKRAGLRLPTVPCAGAGPDAGRC